jgi:hypothetical protein
MGGDGGLDSENLNSLVQGPYFSVHLLEELLHIRIVGDTEAFRVPLDFLSGTVRHVPEMVGFSQRSGIAKMAGRVGSRFAGVDPLLVMIY